MKDNILLIQWMHGIGDNFFTLPAYHLVREAFPEAILTFLVDEKNAQIYQGFPGLDHVITMDRGVYHKKKWKMMLLKTTELIGAVRRGHYKLVIDFASSGETGLLSVISGAKERWGMIKKGKRRFGSAFYTKVYKETGNIHSVDKCLKLVETGGIKVEIIKNYFSVPVRYLEKARSLYAEFDLSLKKPTLFIQPFTSGPGKDWPLEKQIELAEYWSGQGRQVIFGGAPGERQRLEKAMEKFPVIAGKADLLTTAGLMNLSSVVIGGDTGPMHMAVALGKRVVMWMGPTSPERFGPYQRPSWVLQPKNGTDIKQITLQSVINAVEQGFRELQEVEHG